MKETAVSRLQLAWRESTWKKYKSHFHGYASFCYLHGWNPLKPDIDVILSYTQSLIDKHLCFQTVNNHLCGVKTFLLWHGHDSDIWDDHLLRWNRRSAKVTLRDKMTEQSSVSFRDFLTCLFITEKLEESPMHLCFLGLLRISNVGISSLARFDKLRNTMLKNVSDEGDCIKVTMN